MKGLDKLREFDMSFKIQMDHFCDKHICSYGHIVKFYYQILGMCVRRVITFYQRFLSSIRLSTRIAEVKGRIPDLYVSASVTSLGLNLMTLYTLSISQHHYSGTFCSGTGGLLQDLMTKSTIRGNLSAFAPDIVATRAQGLDYVFGETNSFSCHVR